MELKADIAVGSRRQRPAGIARLGPAEGQGRQPRRLHRRHLERRQDLGPRQGRCLRLDQRQRRHQRQAARRRDGRLRLPDAALDPALQEVEGRRRRRHPGLWHQRYRGHGRLHRRGQDPLLLAFVLGPSDRPVRHQRQGQGRQDQARSLQFLRRPLLFGRHPLARHLGGGGLEEEGRLGQGQVHPPRRQPSLSAGAQGSGRGAGQAAGLRRRALDPVRARGRRLQGAVPGAAIVRAPTTRSWPIPLAPTSRCCAPAPRSASTCSSWPTSGAWTKPA